MAKDLMELLLQEKDEKPVILEVIIDGRKEHLKKDGVVKYDDGNSYCVMSDYDVVNSEEGGKVFIYKVDTVEKTIKVVEDMEESKKVYCDFMYKAQQNYEYIPPVKKD